MLSSVNAVDTVFDSKNLGSIQWVGTRIAESEDDTNCRWLNRKEGHDEKNGLLNQRCGHCGHSGMQW